MRLFLGVSLALILAGLTHAETARWQSDRTLWCDAVRLAPTKPRALNNCALALLRGGDYLAAQPLLERARGQIEQREPNRRAALRMTVRANQVLVLLALRDVEGAAAIVAEMEPQDRRTQQYRLWLTSTR